MRLFRYSCVPLLIALLMFFIPFAWLKPGEMDLGGDNSRLYFYNPIAYLVSQSLYSVSHSGLGGENLSYFGIPFMLLLSFVKSIVHSPTILISIFHGINLSLGFFFCYRVVRELLTHEDVRPDIRVIELSGILAGLYYTFSPNPIRWWGFPLLPMNQVFLNPLFFYLLLRFFLSGSLRYLLIAVVLSFVFSPNFSYIGAPTFFSFFPLAGLFLLIYTKYIRKKTIPVAKLVIGLLLFVSVQAFHLLPQIASIVTPGSEVNAFIFGETGKLDWGLKYFLATAPSIKVSYALLGLPQYTTPEAYWWMFAVFPLLFVLGLVWKKSRLYYLNVIFFLITLYFVSANITRIGATLYALAFRLPGFSMFRVYYAQWEWVYLFFYALLVGQSAAVLLGNISRSVRRYLFFGAITALLIVTAWPLISGKLTDTVLWQSKNIRSHVVMDPVFEEALAYVQSLPVDGKILSLPLNDYGYQSVKGANDAAYVGPSTITYIASRNEFNGAVELGKFGPALLAAAGTEDIAAFRDILSMLNVRYIFYNEDPYIYGDNFPGLPFENVKRYFPETQEGYKKFIEKLGAREVKSFGGIYHIYEFDDSSYVPHVYAAKSIAYWNDIIAADPHVPLSFYSDDKQVAIFDLHSMYLKQKEIFDTVLLKARNTSTIFDFFKKKDVVKFVSPTVSRPPSSLVYPLVSLREKWNLRKFKVVNEAYIDRNIYFAEKRINELRVFKNIPVKGNVASIAELARYWKEPALWEVARYPEYDSWEITLARYERAMEMLISDVEKTTSSSYSSITSKVDLMNYFREHKRNLRTAIREDVSLTVENKKYLSHLVEEMFIDLYHALNLRLPDFNRVPFVVDVLPDSETYEVYVNRKDVADINVSLNVGGMNLSTPTLTDGEWMKFGNISVEHVQPLSMILSINVLPNLTALTRWTSAELIIPGNSQMARESDSATLMIKHGSLNDTSGLVRDISKWEKNTMYAISFEYFTNDQNFSVVLRERGGTEKNRYISDIYEETLRAKEWRTFSTVALSGKDADSAFLQITKAIDDAMDPVNREAKKIDIKNLVVQKIYNPRIIFKSALHDGRVPVPQVTFTQLNPTRYKVEVWNAHGPYALVLSQEFNQKWKVFIPDIGNPAETAKGVFIRIIGAVLKAITNLMVVTPSAADLPMATEHAGIREGVHRSIFWDRDMFKTWGEDPIAEEMHLPVNGYANVWYIRPEDVGNKEKYTLYIEMTSQKLFIGSLLLSFGALCIVVIMLVLSFIRKNA